METVKLIPHDIKIACKAVDRIFNNLTEGWNEHEDAMHSIDAGEFSRGMDWEVAEELAMDIVTAAFGFDADLLIDWGQRKSMDEFGLELDIYHRKHGTGKGHHFTNYVRSES